MSYIEDSFTKQIIRPIHTVFQCKQFKNDRELTTFKSFDLPLISYTANPITNNRDILQIHRCFERSNIRYSFAN